MSTKWSLFWASTKGIITPTPCHCQTPLLLRSETFCFLSTWRRRWEGEPGGVNRRVGGGRKGDHAPFISRKVAPSADSVSWTLSSIGTEKQGAEYKRGQHWRRRLTCVLGVAAVLSSARHCCTEEDFSNHVSKKKKLTPLFTTWQSDKNYFSLAEFITCAHHFY